MEERPNSGDQEQCLHGSNDASASGARIPDSRVDETSVESTAAAQRGSILQSLLSRPLDESSAEDSRKFTHDSGPCRTVVEGVGHRPRSRSMGTTWWTIPEVASSTSQDSLDYGDEIQLSGSGCGTRVLGCDAKSLQTDRLIEDARCKLMTLQTSEEYNSSFGSRLSYSQPGTPPCTDMLPSDKLRQQRKYSEGSRLKACLQVVHCSVFCYSAGFIARQPLL